MKATIEELIKSYQTKQHYLRVMIEEEKKGGIDIKNILRLNTKETCYNTFIIELKKLLKDE